MPPRSSSSNSTIRAATSRPAHVGLAVNRSSCTTPTSSGARVSEFAGAVIGFCAMTWAVAHASALLPGLQLSGVSANATVSGIVNLSANATAAGLSSIQFQVSGSNVGPQISSGACATAWDTRTKPDGARTVTVIGRDDAGNAVSATPVLVNVRNGIADTTAPTVSVSSPSSGAVLSGTVTLSASASDDLAVAGVWFTLDGTPIGAETASAPFQLSWATTSVPNGSHTLRAAARDAAGNAATSAAVSLAINNPVAPTRDTAAPAVSVTAPTAGSILSGTMTLSAVANDDTGVVGVQFMLDDANAGNEVRTAPYTITMAVPGGLTGSHVIRAVARDAAGNMSTSSAVVVQFDAQSVASAIGAAPSVAMTSPAYGANVRGSVKLMATATDDVGVTSVQFVVDGSPVGTATGSGPSYQLTWNTGGAGLGHHFVQAVATDAAGNVTVSDSIVVIVVSRR